MKTKLLTTQRLTSPNPLRQLADVRRGIPRRRPLLLTKEKDGMRLGGFTLIELLIAMGIFAVFITIITGIFTNFIQVQRHAIAQSRMISDLTSAMEAFVKEARTGYGSTYSINGNADGIAFINQTGKECVVYRKSDKNIFERAVKAVDDNCNPDSFASSSFTPITSSATQITNLMFVIPKDVIVGNGLLKNQGVITINLTAKSTKDGIPPIAIQNSVTSRQMEPYVQP